MDIETESTYSPDWIEQPVEAFWDLPLWVVVAIFILSTLLVLIIPCCCIRFRIPRTKQEIEADYIRKKITRKFRRQLAMIQNSEMDEMDLKKALDRVRAEFKSDTESLGQTEEEDNEANQRRRSRMVDIEELIEKRGHETRKARITRSLRSAFICLRRRQQQDKPEIPLSA